MEPPNESNPPSLPRDIVLSILARISSLYYPTVSLVSKSFRSIIQSKELYRERSRLETAEPGVVVVFQTSTNPCDRKWFTLGIKPDDHQTSKVNSTGNWLVPLNRSNFVQAKGSEIYDLGVESNDYSSDVWVRDNRFAEPRKAPSMNVARKNPLMCMDMDGKVYVLGGWKEDEFTCWAEVFDPKTQTWEPLPNPGPDLCFSPNNKAIYESRGGIYVTRKNTRKNKKKKEKMKNFIYLIKENRWEVFEGPRMGDSICDIDHLPYFYGNNQCHWFDIDHAMWRFVRGLSEFYEQHQRIDTEICNYGGKLAMVWVDPTRSPDLVSTSEVWCAVVLLEKRHDGEVWGQIDWVDHVLTVPRDYTLSHCVGTLLE